MSGAERNVGASEFKCANCGGQMAYDARATALRCPYCGATQAVSSPMGEVVEHDLREGLQRAQHGLGAQVRTMRCKECAANVNFPAGTTSTKCTFCGSPYVLEQQENAAAIRPESLIPFQIDKKTANNHFERWIKKLWFRPSDLSRVAKVQEVNGVYVPFWTYDADVESHWRADRGIHYYVEEQYTTMENGQQVVRSRSVQHTRWEPAAGHRRDLYDDLLVCASKGLPPKLAEHFKTFNTQLLVPYNPSFLAGWRAEEYAFDLNQGWQVGQTRIVAEQQQRCARDVGGDTHRSLFVTNRFNRVTWKHVLLPVWIAAYRYNNKVYQFLVNGQTGEVVGKAPWSALKILLFILSIVAVIVAIVLLANRGQ